MTAISVTPDEGLKLAQRLAEQFKGYAQVEAVTLSGSRTSGTVVDARSDIDLYVYTEEGEFPLEERRAIVEVLGGATRVNLGLRFWGDGDVWFDARSGIEVDVVYPSKRSTEEALDRILRQHQPSGGYSTGAWHSVRTAHILFDRHGWFGRLQAWSDQPYPPELRRSIIDHNFPILRAIIPSYRYNVEKSLPRHDLVFINNEVTWMLASYFDVLFAFNNVPHPGAKRLLEQVARLCPRFPQDMAPQVTKVLRLSTTGNVELLAAIDQLMDGLEEILGGEAPKNGKNE
jgi:predicted nucleotidyltransferase